MARPTEEAGLNPGTVPAPTWSPGPRLCHPLISQRKIAPNPIKVHSSAMLLGSGAALGAAAIVRFVSADAPAVVVPPFGSPNAIDEMRELLVTPKNSGDSGQNQGERRALNCLRR